MYLLIAKGLNETIETSGGGAVVFIFKSNPLNIFSS